LARAKGLRQYSEGFTQLHLGQQFKYLFENSTLKRVAELANLMGVSHTTVYGYFKQAELDPAVIEKICKIFKISVNQFVGEHLTGRIYLASNEPEMLNMDYDVVKLQKENAELKTRLIDALERIIELNDNLRKLQEKKESN